MCSPRSASLQVAFNECFDSDVLKCREKKRETREKRRKAGQGEETENGRMEGEGREGKGGRRGKEEKAGREVLPGFADRAADPGSLLGARPTDCFRLCLSFSVSRAPDPETSQTGAIKAFS